MSISLTYHITLDLHVHHDEVCAIKRVGHDTSHEGCCKYDGIGLFFVKEFLDSDLVCQIELFVRASNKIRISTLEKIIPNSGTHKSMVSRYIYFTVFV